jgi:L,D-peptidoglycan transpeptidase YkuD (ErfK/YbiS/YcfS/YnhG family)
MAAGLLGVGAFVVLRRSTGADPVRAFPAALTGSALLDAAGSSAAQWDSRTFQLVRPGGHGPATAGLPIPATPTPTATPPAAQPTAPQATGQRPAAAAAPAGGALPLAVNTGSSTQVITVVAPSSGSTTARVTAWQRGASGWTAVVGPVPAMVGRDGVGRASERTSTTPAGTFSLTEAFGRQADPGTGLPYRTINASDYWVSDVNSTRYNQFVECPSSCPFDTSAGEHLWDAGGSYNYAVVIDYNRWPATPGAGSAFFLHVTNGAPTAGCVAIDQGSLLRIMRWLDPAARPLIAIGVG